MGTIFDSGEFSAQRTICASERRRRDRSGRHEIIFVRRGMFLIGERQPECAVTANHALLLPAGSEYEVDHPIGTGEEYFVISVPHDLFEREFRNRRAPMVRLVSNRLFLAQHEIEHSLRRGVQALEAEETLAHLARDAAAAFGATTEWRERPISPRERLTAYRAEELVTTYYTRNLSLSILARECGITPTHLCHVFKRVHGISIHRYQTALRLRASIPRLMAGENDLSGLALDLGYCDHSHFTYAFRRAFGVPPSRVRESVRKSTVWRAA